MELEEQFQILQQYLKTKVDEKAKRVQDEDEEEEEEEEEDRRCDHSYQVVHEGYYVCTSCGIAMDSVYLPEVNWESRCVIGHSYSCKDRIGAVDKHLRHFMEKAGIRASHHVIQEKLLFMKKECMYKSLNYAIALTCMIRSPWENSNLSYLKATWHGREAAECYRSPYRLTSSQPGFVT